MKCMISPAHRFKNYLWAVSCLLLFGLVGCNPKEHSSETVKLDTQKVEDTIAANTDTTASSKIYSNERFKDVTVVRTGEHMFRISGKAQIFEANFGWVVEDGHNELRQGHQMTDAGAPEWGNFSFVITAVKENPNSTLHVILFESSPKDGSRQFELPLILY